jgi:uncharacterized protein YndB with AHSA1/START domain
MTTAPLTMTFDVACSAEHAFSTWTRRIGTWWPRDHTLTGQEGKIVLQAGVGGRIYEQAADGTQHDWGVVTAWQPPVRLAYSWHLGTSRERATDVEIRFVAQGAALTRVEIEHRGWDRLGPDGVAWRDRNVAGWQGLLPSYIDAVAPAVATGDL